MDTNQVKKKILKFKRDLAKLRRGAPNTRQLERFARSVGRVLRQGSHERNYVSTVFPRLRPVSIPHHSSNFNRYIAMGILDWLEQDVASYEQLLDSQQEVQGGGKNHD